MTSRRPLAPLAGIVFAVLFGVGFFAGIGRAPAWEGGDVVGFYMQNKAQMTVASLVIGLSGVALLFFVASLCATLRAAEPTTGTLAAVASAGGIVSAGGVFLTALVAALLTDSAPYRNEAVAQVLQLLVSGFSPGPVQGGMAALLLAAGLVFIRTGVIARSAGWVAVLLAAVAVSPAGFAAFLLSLVWVVAVSVLMIVRAQPLVPAAPVSAAAAAEPPPA